MIMMAAAVFLALVCLGLILFFYLKYKVTRFGQDLLGMPGNATLGDMKKVLDEAYEENCNTPKSLSAMTTVYLPMIVRDFPYFNFDQMKQHAEAFLLAHLRALDALDAGLAQQGDEDYRNQLDARIETLKAAGCREHFEMTKIHGTEISAYVKTPGKCIITFQSALECIHYEERDGQIRSGDRDHKYQTRYETDLIYIQNRDMLSNDSERSLGMNCPNCGAPIESLGSKVCPYCGTTVQEINVMVWTFAAVREKK